ncbi:hypothetical protein D3C78_1795730 [compost metagenome]
MLSFNHWDKEFLQHGPELFGSRFVQALDRAGKATRAAHIAWLDSYHMHSAVYVAPQIVTSAKQNPASDSFLVIPMHFPVFPIFEDFNDR